MHYKFTMRIITNTLLHVDVNHRYLPHNPPKAMTARPIYSTVPKGNLTEVEPLNRSTFTHKHVTLTPDQIHILYYASRHHNQVTGKGGMDICITTHSL